MNIDLFRTDTSSDLGCLWFFVGAAAFGAIGTLIGLVRAFGAVGGRQLAALDEARRGYADGTKGLLRDPELSLALKWEAEQRPTAAAARRYQVDLSALEQFLRKSSKAAQVRAWSLWSAVILTIVVLSTATVLPG